MVKCGTCGAALSTRQLTALPSDFEPEWEDHVELVPTGQYWLASNTFWLAASEPNDYIVINGDDATGLQMRHPKGASGCCGNSSHLRNQACSSCGTPVGIRIDDCWTGYYTYFPAGEVEIERS